MHRVLFCVCHFQASSDSTLTLPVKVRDWQVGPCQSCTSYVGSVQPEARRKKAGSDFLFLCSANQICPVQTFPTHACHPRNRWRLFISQIKGRDFHPTFFSLYLLPIFGAECFDSLLGRIRCSKEEEEVRFAPPSDRDSRISAKREQVGVGGEI